MIAYVTHIDVYAIHDDIASSSFFGSVSEIYLAFHTKCHALPVEINYSKTESVFATPSFLGAPEDHK